MAHWEVVGKTVLVTGGASGLGAAFTEPLLKDGAKSIAILDIAEEVGKAKAESLNKVYSDKVIFIKCDVSKEEDVAKAFDEVVAKFKQVDVIVNNAGLFDDSPDVWRTASTVDWQGVVSFSLKGIKHMRKDEGGIGGTIINISSVAGLRRFPYTPIYCGSKMAVLHFTQCIAVPPFYERTGIRMLTICPGLTDTAIVQGMEKRCYEPKDSEAIYNLVGPHMAVYQKIESVASAFMHMFKNGAPGSIWLSVNNKPAFDITSIVDTSFKAFEEKIESLK